MSDVEAQEGPGRLAVEVRALLELFALCGLAVTQPLLDIFGRAPQQFAFRGVEGSGVVLFAVVVTFAPALALGVVGAAVGVVAPRARAGAHRALVGLLVVAVALQVVAPLVSGVPRLVVAAGAGVGAVVAHRRLAWARTWLAFMAVAPLGFLALFLLVSPSSRLLGSPDAVALEGGVGRPAPVVVVVFDELPLASLVGADGTVDAELFPNFAALAEGSHWYRNTTTVSSSTWYAVPALLTGRVVPDGRAPIAADHPESLFTLLGDAYDLNVTESVTRVCPAELCAVADVGAGGRRQVLRDARDVLVSRLSYSGPAADPVAALVEPVAGDGEGTAPDDGDETTFADFGLNQPARISTFADGVVDARPALHYLHVLLPHVPYRYLPSGARYDGPDPDLGRLDDDWSDQAWLVDLGRQRHLLQLGYVDALLGEVVDLLRQRGVYDEALLVVTSDHGISFEAGGPIRGIAGQDLDGGVLADVAWVPLFVKEPGQQVGTVSDANVLTVDVVPTIADVLDVEVPWPLDGRSVLGPPRPDGAKPFRPSEVNPFGVAALGEVRLDERSDLDVVLGRGVDRLLAPGGGADRWWRLGPEPGLVGTDVAAGEATGVLAEVPAEVADPGALDLVPGSERVPALVRGRVEGPDPGDPLAVSVNGVVAATGLAYGDGDATAFAVVVGDDRFSTGPNDVRVHRLVG